MLHRMLLLSSVYLFLALCSDVIAFETGADVSAVFNSDEWVMVNKETAKSSDGRLPPKATDTWKDPNVEVSN